MDFPFYNSLPKLHRENDTGRCRRRRWLRLVAEGGGRLVRGGGGMMGGEGVLVVVVETFENLAICLIITDKPLIARVHTRPRHQAHFFVELDDDEYFFKVSAKISLRTSAQSFAKRFFLKA
jgi:hypothetical protein